MFVLLTENCVPSTNKSPCRKVLPPTYKSRPIAAPPRTCSAPLEVDIALVVLVKTRLLNVALVPVTVDSKLVPDTVKLPFTVAFSVTVNSVRVDSVADN